MRLALSLIVTALSLPSQAQYQPPGGGGSGPPQAAWKVTYTYDGTTEIITPGPPVQTIVYVWTPMSPSGVTGPTNFRMSGNYKVTATGTVTAKIKWLYTDGTSAPNPPQWVNVRKTASASYQIGGNLTSAGIVYATGSGSASNGIGSPCIVTQDPTPTAPPVQSITGISGSSYERRYETLDGSSGTITIPVTLNGTASVTVNRSDGGGGYLAAPCSFGVEVIDHAHPCNYRKDASFTPLQLRSDLGNLHMHYLWDSTGGAKMPDSGVLSDLVNCTVGEYVVYSGAGTRMGGYFYPTSPPFALSNYRDPEISGVGGADGHLDDDHTAGDPIPVFRALSFTGNQKYRAHCSVCMNADEYLILATYSIVRRVILVPGHTDQCILRIDKADDFSERPIQQ